MRSVRSRETAEAIAERLVAWLGERAVGIANYVRLRNPSVAEAAFVVDRLLDRAARR